VREPMAARAEGHARSVLVAAIHERPHVVRLHPVGRAAAGALAARERERTRPKCRLLGARAARVAGAAVRPLPDQVAAADARALHLASQGMSCPIGCPIRALWSGIPLARALMPPRRIELRFQP
jgi:hypothetical protein